MDERVIAQLSTEIDETWTAEQRATFLGLDLTAMRRTTVVLATLAIVAFATIMLVATYGLLLLAPAENLPLPLVLAGVSIGLVVGAALSVSLALLVGTRLVLARPLVQQSVVATAIAFFGFVTMYAAQTLGGSPWLITVAFGLTAWTLFEGAWQQSTVTSALRRPVYPRRALAMLAAQRAELGLGGHATVLGLSPAREAIGGLGRGVVVISCAALVAISPLLGLVAALVRLMADLADVAALTTQRRRLISIAPAVAAILLVAAVAALY